MRNHTKGKDVRKVAHTPYGYRIENGRAVIDEEKAAPLSQTRIFRVVLSITSTNSAFILFGKRG